MCGYFYWLNSINALNTTDEHDQDREPTSPKSSLLLTLGMPNKIPFNLNSILADRAQKNVAESLAEKFHFSHKRIGVR